jgi:hypothetical protein
MSTYYLLTFFFSSLFDLLFAKWLFREINGKPFAHVCEIEALIRDTKTKKHTMDVRW